jgi:phosphoserine phosphatase RsbU/P
MHHIIDNLSFNMLIIRVVQPEQADVPVPCIHQVNHLAETFLGYREKELEGQPLTKILIIGKETASWLSAILKSRKKTEDNCFEGKIITKDQHKIKVLLLISPLADKDQKHTDHTDFFILFQTIEPNNYVFRMRRVVEQSASAMMITDRAGFIEYVNPKFMELTGYSAEEMLGQNPRMLQSGNMTAECYQAMWQTLIDTGEWHGEIQNQKKNGEIYWVYESISAITNSENEITHFVAVEEDITRRKVVESALTESEERFRQIAELTGEWLWEQDPGGYYIYSSNGVKQILGFSQEEILGKHYTVLLTKHDQEVQQSYANNRKPFTALVNHYQHKNGRQVITESSGLAIINDEGNLIKWRGVDHDITARMHFQEALIDSEKRTRLIIESSINAIVIMDSYGIITDWNHRAEKMMGWSREEAVGQRLDDLIIPARFHKAHRQGLKKYLETGEGPLMNKQTETVALRRDGTEFPIELSVSPLKLGNTYIFSGFIHDISGRKAAEEQIRQAHVNLAIAQNEIRIAQQIQSILSPSAPIKSSNFEVAGFCLPADKVGGDYYDYFYRNENQLDIVIADVSGHSIGPALFMVETRSALRAQTNLSATPSQTLGVLNNFLFNDLDQSDYFITLFYLQVDIYKHQVRYANAGHPPPLLLSHNSSDFTELDAEGLVLGIRKNIVFETKTASLERGDLILFYTDGLVEAENPVDEFFGLERVKWILLQHAQDSPQQIIDALKAALQEFCLKSIFADDITLMVFKYE